VQKRFKSTIDHNAAFVYDKTTLEAAEFLVQNIFILLTACREFKAELFNECGVDPFRIGFTNRHRSASFVGSIFKQLTQKIFVSYDDVPTNKQLCAIMKATGISPTQIAHDLGITRNTIYYYMERDQDLPTRCMLTYGEYNLMLDFTDCWEEIKRMDILYGQK
jgi:hypothetical protein